MPQMQLSTLVLPAPFGPMSARILPASSANETSSITFRPPKASYVAQLQFSHTSGGCGGIA